MVQLRADLGPCETPLKEDVVTFSEKESDVTIFLAFSCFGRQFIWAKICSNLSFHFYIVGKLFSYKVGKQK